MATILFKCLKCSAPLAVETALAGQTVACAACGQSVQVPRPAVLYQCPQCHANLCSPLGSMALDAVCCPQCSAEVQVPVRGTRPDKSASAGPVASELRVIRPDAAEHASPPCEVPPERHCKYCGHVVAPAAIICANCGTNLFSGRKYGQKLAPRGVPGGPLMAGFVVVLLATLGLGGWHYWQQRQATAARIEAENQRAILHRSHTEQCRQQILEASDVFLFDALACALLASDLPLSVDPDAVSAMRDRVALPVFSGCDLAGLKTALGNHGLIVRQCPVSGQESNLVSLVTTEANWAYELAGLRLPRHQVDEAIQTLDGARLDHSAYGQHAAALRRLLADQQASEAACRKLAQQVAATLGECDANYSSARMFQRSAQLTSNNQPLSESTRAAAQALASSRYESALKGMLGACSDLERFAQKTVTNEAFCARVEDAFAAGLHTEAGFFAQAYLETFATMERLSADVGKSSILFDTDLAQFYNLRTTLDQCVRKARAISERIGRSPDALLMIRRVSGEHASSAANQIATLERARPADAGFSRFWLAANQGFAADRGNLFARAAAGTVRLQAYLQALRVMRAQNREVVARRGGAPGSGDLPQAGTRLDATGRIGSVMRLSFLGATAQATPLSVLVKAREGAGQNVVFAPDGHGGRHLERAAQDVYQWLRDTPGAGIQNRAIQIIFPDLATDQGGDSVGAALALAAYSSVTSTAVLQDVTIIGDFHSDGSIGRVAGVYEQVCGATMVAGVSVIIVPRDNEADLMLLPMDKLCRIVVISAADIRTVIPYATDPTFNRGAFDRLRRAQALVLAGRWEESEPLLLEALADAPELDTARRLLELLAFWKKADLIEVKAPVAREGAPAAVSLTPAPAEHAAVDGAPPATGVIENPTAAAVIPAPTATNRASDVAAAPKLTPVSFKRPAQTGGARKVRRLGE